MALRGLFVGLTTLDLVHRLDRLPGPDEKVTALEQALAPGGPAAVAAVTFAALGGAASVVTVLGAHPLADLARADLRGNGVEVIDAEPTRTAAPAVSAVRVEDHTGRRSVSSPDAAAGASPGIHEGIPSGPAPATPDIAGPPPPPGLADAVDAADVVLLDGHWPRLALTAAAAARAAGVPVVLDAGRWRPVFADLVPQADFVVASAAFSVDGAPDVLEACLALGAGAVARTDGERPVRWATRAGGSQIAVEAVSGGDTLGAGDVFHGAVAFAVAALGAGPALAHWPDTLEFAAAVARVRVGHTGPRTWVADPRLRQLAAPWRA